MLLMVDNLVSQSLAQISQISFTNSHEIDPSKGLPRFRRGRPKKLRYFVEG